MRSVGVHFTPKKVFKEFGNIKYWLPLLAKNSQHTYPKIPNKGRTSNKMGAPIFSTSDGIISKTVCPIYLKIDVLIVHIGHS